MRRDYTLIATPRPPSLAPLAPLHPGPPVTAPPRPRVRLRALREWSLVLAALSVVFALPLFVTTALGLPDLWGLVAWGASVPIAWVLSATAPPSEYRPVLPRRSASQEPVGLGAYYAYQDWSSDGDGGGC